MSLKSQKSANTGLRAARSFTPLHPHSVVVPSPAFPPLDLASFFFRFLSMPSPPTSSLGDMEFSPDFWGPCVFWCLVGGQKCLMNEQGSAGGFWRLHRDWVRVLRNAGQMLPGIITALAPWWQCLSWEPSYLFLSVQGRSCICKVPCSSVRRVLNDFIIWKVSKINYTLSHLPEHTITFTVWLETFIIRWYWLNLSHSSAFLPYLIILTQLIVHLWASWFSSLCFFASNK